MALILFAAVALTACTGDLGEDTVDDLGPSVVENEPTSEAASFDGYEAFVEEYVDAVDSLEATLPEGTELSSDPIGDWDRDGRYEAGAGEMHAAFQWQCAWMASYENSKAANDQEEMGTALNRLEEWVSLSEVEPHIDDASRAMWMDQVIAPARGGDDAFLLELGAGC